MHESNSSFAADRSSLPLAALRAFDAAARLGSFRLAADALGLTPSAVSHQIKALERTLGVALFQRQNRAVLLSETGARFAPFVRQGFAAFARGAAVLREGARARQIRVSSLALFSQAVLIPALAGFATRWPDYDVRIESTPRFTDFDREDVDLAIRVGNGRWPRLKCTELLRIMGSAVASPRYLEDRRIRDPRDLVGARLIHDSAQPRAWSAWLAAQGIEGRDEGRDLWFDSAPATLQAAEQHLGVALGIDPLVRRWPGYGASLVPACPGTTGPATRYWLVRRAESDADAKIKAAVAWIRGACRDLRLPKVAARNAAPPRTGQQGIASGG
jgi:LysR family glycine cleavage system transcriptional activator